MGILCFFFFGLAYSLASVCLMEIDLVCEISLFEKNEVELLGVYVDYLIHFCWYYGVGLFVASLTKVISISLPYWLVGCQCLLCIYF